MAAINQHYSYFRSPFGDVLGLFANSQHYPRCRELELNVLDCTDVYGHKGLTKQCNLEYEDYLECLYNKKQHWEKKVKRYYSVMGNENTYRFIRNEIDSVKTP
ncbi:complex I-15 kDa [Caerostris extrusa]|uniref:Complex I-15 kDa n=1 Tax=Caerostris extrusa TaxID=172846 RepID=A0AAV4SBY6_CAEEX|nr:complex I-15 kDa [Caerostris extrusa]